MKLVIAMGPGLDRIKSSVRFLTCPETQPGASWQAKPVPILANPRVLPGLARPVSSDHQFSFSGVSMYGRCQICDCYVQNINFGI